MVLIHLKRGDDSVFLFETPASSSLQILVPDIAAVYNKILRIRRLISATIDLVEYGPLKPPSEQGYTDEQLEEYASEKETTEVKEKQEIIVNGMKMILNADPTGRRMGVACSQEYADIILQTLKDAENVISKDLVHSGKVMTVAALDQAIANVQGAVMMAYPMGLPEGETVKDILEDNEELTGTAVVFSIYSYLFKCSSIYGKKASKEVIQLEDATLWWAGKELARTKLLSDYVGKNDKTKVIVKLQRKGQGAPIREAPLSEQAQKEMMAYYYRKQEEHKKLVENDDDDYVNSSWADPKALKSAFTGVGKVKWG